MERTVAEYIQICEWDPAKFLIFSDNVFGILIYYSHLLPLVVSLFFAIFVFSKNSKLLSTRWFLVTATLLAIWLFSDLVLWATEKPEFTMFFWSIVNMVEPMIYAGILFFIYAFIDNKDISLKQKLIIFALLLPTIILASTNLNLGVYDLSNCYRETIEGPLPYYSYLIETIFALWILGFGIKRFFKFKDRGEKTKTILVTSGAVFFLLSFAMGNVIGSLLVDWEIGQYGLFGIPVFIAILSYLIVKYHVFNIKLIATQILVVTLWVLTLAILFLGDLDTVRIVVYITLILFTILGFLLVRSVKREVTLREQLEVANEGQANLIHIINHQIKGYLSKARNIFSELLTDNGYGPIPEQAKPMLDEGFKSLTEGVGFVKDFLDSANIEKGSYEYVMEPLDMKALVKDVVEKQKSVAEERGLSYEVNLGEGDYNLKGDKAQLNQAIRNLIDNSIRYTPKGGLAVNLSRINNKILFTVKDTGVGISNELKPKLFTKGGRDKDSLKINVNSTGFGLSFVKGVVLAHKGRVWAESAGPNLGSTFYMELPAN